MMMAVATDRKKCFIVQCPDLFPAHFFIKRVFRLYDQLHFTLIINFFYKHIGVYFSCGFLRCAVGRQEVQFSIQHYQNKPGLFSSPETDHRFLCSLCSIQFCQSKSSNFSQSAQLRHKICRQSSSHTKLVQPRKSCSQIRHQK